MVALGVWGSTVATTMAQESPIQIERQTTDQAFERLDSNTTASFRGLSVVDRDTFWVSGSNGTVLRSDNGGSTLVDVSVSDAAEVDFRDIHAFDALRAVVMGVGSPGVLYRTEDGGQTWDQVYEDQRANIFFDAMDFWNDQQGIAFGDPIDGHLVIIRTEDGGKTWRELERESQPKVATGEGGFAASGTCLITDRAQSVWIGSGSHLEGKSAAISRIFFSDDFGANWTSIQVPLARNQSSGIFSVCLPTKNHLVVVGGDYRQPEHASNHLAISNDAGKSWVIPESQQSPRGFRSVVISCDVEGQTVLFAAGTSGADVSCDLGHSWQAFGTDTINALAASPDGSQLFAAGPDGTVFRRSTSDVLVK